MATFGFIVVTTLLIAFCVLREFQWQATMEKREAIWRNTVDGLLDRIQAPEVAVVRDQPPTEFVPPDDDGAYWDDVKEREGEPS